MSRIGKIARLPKAIREELNRRLEDGEEGKGLVAWLNGHAEVQAVLKDRFDGRPLNEPNLTAWRQGGYEDWRQQQESLEMAGRLVEESAVAEAMARQDEPGGVTGSRTFTDRAAMMAALAIGEQLMAVRRMEDGAEKRRAVLKLVRGLVRLRQTDREHERAQRDAAQAERSAEIHEAWAEGARRRRSSAPPAAQRPACSGRDSASGSAGCEDRSACRFARDAKASAYAEATADRTAGREEGMEDRSIDESIRQAQGLGPGLRSDAALEEELRGLSDAELMQRLEDLKELHMGRKAVADDQ